MARPSENVLVGADAARKWREIEDVRKASKLNADRMARLLGFTSGGAYRGWKAKGELPVKRWEQFERVRPLIKDYEEEIEVLTRRLELLAEAEVFGEGEPRAVAVINRDFAGLIGVNGTIRKIAYNGEPRTCEREGCQVEFIPRSWNHRVCSRTYHLQQEREQKRPRPSPARSSTRESGCHRSRAR